MTGSGTKYKNTTRTIAGAINFVFQTDVVLLCDTSLGVVDLTLLDIPQGNFSTQYKLYVVDKSNNASANNITIKAPTGFTVNNSATAVINVNGGVAVLTISSNKTYNVSYNYTIGGGGGNPLIIKNEGTQITPSATSIDFVGAPVTATAVGNDVTVTITDNGGHPIAIENEGTQITPDVAKINFTGSIVNATAVGNDVTVDITLGFISVSYSALTTLISTNALIPSQQYLITDAIFVNAYPFDITDFKENVPIVVTAVTTNEISLSGSGIFLNADYQSIGDYSGVTGFVAPPQRIWNLANTYVIGNVVIWDNAHWVNITGTNASEPTLSSPDWTFLPKTSTNGYITEIDIVKYNVATNQITYREDVRNNRVENNIATYLDGENREAFWVWQWGNDSVTSNTILAQSYFCIKNQTGTILSNLLDNYSVIYTNAEVQSGIISYNIVLQNSFVEITNTPSIPAVIPALLTLAPTPSAIPTVSQNTFKSCASVNIINQGLFISNDFQSVSGLSLTNTGSSSIIKNNFFKYGLCPNQVNNAVDGGRIEQNEIDYFNDNFCENTSNITNNGGTISKNKLYHNAFLRISFNSGQIINNISEQSGRIDIIKNDGIVQNNTISQGGLLRISGADNPNNTGTIGNNEIIGGTITVVTNNSDIQYNNVQSSSRLIVNSLNNSTLSFNTLTADSDLTIQQDNLGVITGNNLSNQSILTLDNVLATAEVSGNFLSNRSQLIVDNISTINCEGTVSNNILLNSEVTLKGGVSATGTFVGNIVQRTSIVRITNQLIGQMERNQLYDNSEVILTAFSTNTSIFYSNYLNSTTVDTDVINFFQYNNLNDCFWKVITNQNNLFAYNVWTSVSFQPTTIDVNLTNTEIHTAFYSCPTFSIPVQGGVIQNGIGTTKYELDMNDPAIWDSTKNLLTIPICLSTFFGYFELKNCGGKSIQAVANSSKRFPTRFFNNETGTIVTFIVNNSVATAGTEELVYNVVGAFPINLRVDFNFGVKDYIDILRLASDINIIQEYKHYV